MMHGPINLRFYRKIWYNTTIQSTGKEKVLDIHFLCKNWRTTFKEKLQTFSSQE